MHNDVFLLVWLTDAMYDQDYLTFSFEGRNFLKYNKYSQ